jgi:hypothetical protein
MHGKVAVVVAAAALALAGVDAAKHGERTLPQIVGASARLAKSSSAMKVLGLRSAPVSPAPALHLFGAAAAELSACAFQNNTAVMNSTRCFNLGPVDLGLQDSCCAAVDSPTSQCRSDETSRAYCDATVDDCSSAAIGQDKLVMNISLFTDATQDNTCCRSCTCFGDPECQSFNGTWQEWVECDGRVFDASTGKCSYTEAQCKTQKDAHSDTCGWVQGSDGNWNYKYGSPCQSTFASGYAEMLMYKSQSGLFGAELVLGERGAIWWLQLNTTQAPALTLSAQQCFEGGLNRSAAFPGAPAAWTVAELGSAQFQDLRYQWTILDPVERVELRVECSAMWHAGMPGQARLDISYLRDQNQISSNAGEGFCVSGVISEMVNSNPQTPQLDQECWANTTVVDVCQSLMNASCADAACTACVDSWCDIANIPAGEVATCKSDIADLGVSAWLTWYAKTIQDAARQQYNVIATNLKQNALYLDMLVAEYGNGSVNSSIICATSLSEYTSNASIPSCVDTLQVQYLNKLTGEWVTVFWIPANKPLCFNNQSQTLSFQDYPELFLNQLRFEQCQADSSCDALRCNPVIGFDVDIQFETGTCTERPTAQPTTAPTRSPTPSPSKAPTTAQPTTAQPTTAAPTTALPTTAPTRSPTPSPSKAPTTAPTTEAPTTEAPTTEAPTTEAPTTEAPTTPQPTAQPTDAPTIPVAPTARPTEALACVCKGECSATDFVDVVNFGNELTQYSSTTVLTLYEEADFQVNATVAIKAGIAFVEAISFGAATVFTAADCKAAGETVSFNNTFLPASGPVVASELWTNVTCALGPEGCAGEACRVHLQVSVGKVDQYVEFEAPNNFIEIEKLLNATGVCIDNVSSERPGAWQCSCGNETFAPTKAPTTGTPTGTRTPTRSPTEQPTTLRPTSTPGGNLTCTIEGDPYVTCFSGNLFQVVPQKNNSWFTVYNMPNRLLAVGDLETNFDGKKWVTLATQLYVEYDNQPQALINYKDNCEPELSTLSMRAAVLYGGELYYEWPATGEYLLLQWECPTDAAGNPAGMKIVVNKLDTKASGSELDWELAQGYSGVCPKCNGNQPYYGPIPGVRTGIPTAAPAPSVTPAPSSSVVDAPTSAEAQQKTPSAAGRVAATAVLGFVAAVVVF